MFIMKKVMVLILAGLLMLGITGMANAGIYASSVEATTTHHWDTDGFGAKTPALPENALGAPDGLLTGWMMGGGYIEVGFDFDLMDGVGDDLTVYSFGPGTSSVSIFDGTAWTLLGSVPTTMPGDLQPSNWDFGGINNVSLVRIDKSSGTPGKFFDAFEGHHPVPIPGAVWLLGSGLLGLIGIRRRKN